ncbi:MAG: thiamine-phosphate kinase [Methanobacteriaceae archaeon]|nr:thiamine-phosphate kinase [Methanobacteriaceae archaeon]MDO9628200.1 thiamine-phosphate kinase [Methanobacteriaceae archaeon]
MSSKKPLISDLGEKKLIDLIIQKARLCQKDYFSTHPQIRDSLGDDAALMEVNSKYLVSTSDMLLQESHFPPQMTHRQMGWKIVTVNVSDLAAMGAHPRGILISMGLPRDMTMEQFNELVEGILDACTYYETPLIGGDTNESPQIVLNGTALGEVNNEKVLMKKTPQKGNLIAVTGPLGLAAAGFEVLLAEDNDSLKKIELLKGEFVEKAVNHALEPRARIKEGIIASESKIVTACTDITDGLASELYEMLKPENTIGIRIYEDKIPSHSLVEEVGKITGKKLHQMTLYYGEDFELLLTVKKDEIGVLKNLMNVYVIGEVTDSAHVEIVDKDGKTSILPPGGYQHLGG